MAGYSSANQDAQCNYQDLDAVQMTMLAASCTSTIASCIHLTVTLRVLYTYLLLVNAMRRHRSSMLQQCVCETAQPDDSQGLMSATLGVTRLRWMRCSNLRTYRTQLTTVCQQLHSDIAHFECSKTAARRDHQKMLLIMHSIGKPYRAYDAHVFQWSQILCSS